MIDSIQCVLFFHCYLWRPMQDAKSRLAVLRLFCGVPGFFIVDRNNSAQFLALVNSYDWSYWFLIDSIIWLFGWSRLRPFHQEDSPRLINWYEYIRPSGSWDAVTVEDYKLFVSQSIWSKKASKSESSLPAVAHMYIKSLEHKNTAGYEENNETKKSWLCCSAVAAISSRRVSSCQSWRPRQSHPPAAHRTRGE